MIKRLPCCLCLFLLAFLIPSNAQIKRALIIGIGNYPDPANKHWPVINSSRDIPLIKNTLMAQGFTPDKITVLSDASATKKGIETALDNLLETAQPGETVLIHVSAHGAQIEDDDIDEEPDILDECIVPYGAVYSPDEKDFKDIVGGYYRDDDFGEVIIKLRNKLGSKGNVLVILDACHSGSGTRDKGDLIRGPNNSIVSPGFDQRKITSHPDAGVINEQKNTTVLGGDAATYVSISGAQSDQPNTECRDENYKSVGSLSYAFSKAMGQLRTGATYRTLFSLVENIMLTKVPRQKPVLEGDGIDKQLFDSKYVIQKPYLSIIKDRSSPGKIVLDGGNIRGVTKGSKIGFYDFQTLDPSGKNPLATGTVSEVSDFISIVIPDRPMENEIKENPRAFITELAWGDRKLKLAILGKDGKPANAEKIETFKRALAGFELVEFNDVYDAFLMPGQDNSIWTVSKRGSNDIFADSISISDDTGIARFKESLRTFDRVKYLEELIITEPGITGRIELVFLDSNKKVDTAMIGKRTVNGRLELREEDVIYLKIVNTGERRIWYNVVDIQPDGKINRIVPNRLLRNANNAPNPILSQDCYLNKGDSTILSQLKITIFPPYGNEIFKVFLSGKEFNVEDILATDEDNIKREVKGAFNNLEKIFINSKVNTEGKRGGGTVSVSSDQTGTMFNVNFTINRQ